MTTITQKVIDGSDYHFTKTLYGSSTPDFKTDRINLEAAALVGSKGRKMWLETLQTKQLSKYLKNLPQISQEHCIHEDLRPFSHLRQITPKHKQCYLVVAHESTATDRDLVKLIALSAQSHMKLAY